MRLFKRRECEQCKAKDEEIAYLRQLIDKLLARLNVEPVYKPDLEEHFEEPREQESGVEEVG